ncbi:MAG: hypothetical protein N2560_06845 [Ignavibacteria bacterium]|nr:hypothetical protein [Ignavibacteria bacterium]
MCDFLAKFGCCSFCVSYPKTFAWIIKKSNEKIRYELSKRNKYLQDSLLLASIQYLQNIEIKLDYYELLSKILKGLSEDKQELLLYLLNGYKVKEIAENYNITISAAEKRVQRLKKYLRENYNLEI